jgi:hypothetical protein
VIQVARAAARIQLAAFSAIISVGELVLPLVMVGMAPASTTRRPANDTAASIAHPHLRIEHGHRVVVTAHLGGAHRVKDGGGNVTSQPGQVLVTLELRARLPFLWLVLCQRRLGHDAPRDAQ